MRVLSSARSFTEICLLHVMCLPWVSTTIKIMFFPQFRWLKPLGYTQWWLYKSTHCFTVGIPGSIDYDKLHRSRATFDKRWSNLIFCEKITLKTCEGSRIPEPFHQPGFHEVHIGSCQCKGSFCGAGCFRSTFAMKKTAPNVCFKLF